MFIIHYLTGLFLFRIVLTEKYKGIKAIQDDICHKVIEVKCTEAVAQRCSIKKEFFEISQDSQETTFQNQVGFNKQILSYVYVYLLPSEVSLQLKNVPKNIYKNKCCEDEIDIIFNSPCLFTSNALIQFKQPMFVYEKYFNAGVSIYISHITIFTFATYTPPI